MSSQMEKIMTAKNKNQIEDKLQSSIRTAQKRLAGFLTRHFNKLSNSAQKLVLLLFGLAVGSVCVLLIAQSLWSDGNRDLLLFNDITTPEKKQIPIAIAP